MRKPLSYDNLTILDPEATTTGLPRKPSPAPLELAPTTDGADSELLRDVAHQTMMYLHVDGVRALDEYALAKSTLHHKIKRHDLIVEAIEEWAEKRGIRARFRAKERKFKARRRYVVVSE
jgi:hypothetical protein